MVNPIIFLFPFFSLQNVTAVVQTDINAAARLIAIADSVILISHVATNENHDKPLGLVAPPGVAPAPEPMPFPSFFAGEDINPAIIVQHKLLPKLDIIALAKIIRTPVKKSNIGYVPLCFEPHHAILIYNKGRFSYIDICFHCSNLVTSADIKLSNMDFENGKWKEMKAFFLQHSLTYEIDDNR